MKLGAFEGGESQLSFALLFVSIRAFSEKKNYPKFSLYVRGGTSNLQAGAIYIYGGSLSIQDSTFERNQATGYVSADVQTILDLFSAFSEPALCSMWRGGTSNF